MSDNAVRLPEEAPLLSGARVPLLVTTLVLAALAFQLNASLLAPAIPTIAADLGIDVNAAGQLQSLFFLSGSVLGMIAARWSDAIGRRSALLVVMALLIGGSVLTLVATSLPLLLVGRVLQGAASAAYTISYIVLGEELNKRHFAIAVGVVTAVNGGLGGLDGYLGGFIAQTWGWRASFVLILAVSVVAVIGIVTLVPRARRTPARRMDWPGAILLGLFLVSLTQFISQLSSAGLIQPATLSWLVVGIVAIIAFAVIERRTDAPMVPLEALGTRQVWPVIATTLLTLAGVYSSTNFTIVILSQDHGLGFGLDPALSGLLFLTPTAIAGVISAPAAGWVAHRLGWVRTVRIASVGIAALSLLLAVFAFNQWVVFALLIVMGVLYLGVFTTAISGISVLNSPAEAPGSLPGLNGACFGLGASIGIALVAPLVAAGGFQSALVVSTVITVAAAVMTFILRPSASAEPSAASEGAQA